MISCDRVECYRIILFDNMSFHLLSEYAFQLAPVRVQLTDEMQDIHKNEYNRINRNIPKSNSRQFDEEIGFLNKFYSYPPRILQ